MMTTRQSTLLSFAMMPQKHANANKIDYHLYLHYHSVLCADNF